VRTAVPGSARCAAALLRPAPRLPAVPPRRGGAVPARPVPCLPRSGWRCSRAARRATATSPGRSCSASWTTPGTH